MPLHIEMLTDDEQDARICGDYWLQGEQGYFALKIKDVAKFHGMQPQSVSRFVAERASVWVDEILCPGCVQPYRWNTRSEYRKRDKFRNRVCTLCLERERKKSEKEKEQEREKNCLIRDLKQPARNETVDLERIDLKGQVYLLSSLQSLSNEELITIGPLNHYPACTLSPDPDYDKKILSQLIDKNILLIGNGTYSDLVVSHDNGQLSVDIEKSVFELAINHEKIPKFVNDFFDDAKLYLLKKSDEFIEICMDVQMHECIAFWNLALEKHQIYHYPGNKTRIVLSQYLAKFSVAQACSFIWSGVKNAAAFYMRNSIGREQAAEASIIYVSQSMDRAVEQGLEITPYNRNLNLPQSCLSRIIFTAVLGTDDGGFNNPLHKIIEIKNPEFV